MDFQANFKVNNGNNALLLGTGKSRSWLNNIKVNTDCRQAFKNCCLLLKCYQQLVPSKAFQQYYSIKMSVSQIGAINGNIF